METETTTLPIWRVRLAQVHEHETVPQDKPGKKPMSSQAKAAKMIRASLAQVFPGVTFSVTSESFAGGDAIRIDWTDGPTTKMVEAVSNRHEYGHFDGMYDIYEYSNKRDDIPQSKYITTTRTFSRAAWENAAQHINKYWGYELRVAVTDYGSAHISHESNQWTGNGYQSEKVTELLYKYPLICLACDWHVMPDDNFCECCGAKLHEQDA